MNYVVNTPAQLKPILVGYRKSNGMSQKDMAEKLNVTQQAYQALESNPQAATLERLMKVFNVLGVKLYLSDSEQQPSVEKQNTHNVSSEASQVIVKPNNRATVIQKTMQKPAKNSPSNQITKKLIKDSW